MIRILKREKEADKKVEEKEEDEEAENSRMFLMYVFCLNDALIKALSLLWKNHTLTNKWMNSLLFNSLIVNVFGDIVKHPHAYK